ncbi:MAG TPA: sugar phosphate isomerase/epimerase [Armatimonadota bacterium]|nr:sugar phosphate isomerase/epimerase [Armatimonadota bacterium]
MKLQLGINCGFAINRFPEPEVWLRIVGEELGLRSCQFVADLLNPFLPQDLVDEQADKILENMARYDVKVGSTFTSQFTRVNHILHPDPHTRETWFEWMKRWIDLSVKLGAEGVGSHFGILSVTDNNDPALREERVSQGVEYWRRLAEYGAERGLRWVLFEPMSIRRELGETIAETQALLDRFAAIDMPIPMELVLDVDHGDVSSTNPDDTDPYAWLRQFGAVSPVIHLKQSKMDKGGHWPFTPEHNENGKITGEKVLAALEEAGCEESTLVLELSHREREPADSNVVSDLKASVEYWREFVTA